MKYANLIHNGLNPGTGNRIINLGDAFEILAVDELYREMGIPREEILEIDLYSLSSYDGEYAVLPVNFMMSPTLFGRDMLRMSDKIIPVFLGLCLCDTDVTEGQLAYLRQWEPIGCRDERTLNFLRSRNIKAYLGGCLVTALKGDNTGGGYIRAKSGRGTDIFLLTRPSSWRAVSRTM